jgi:hypothetical protein
VGTDAQAASYLHRAYSGDNIHGNSTFGTTTLLCSTTVALEPVRQSTEYAAAEPNAITVVAARASTANSKPD